ncbi:PQQ-binding-like beta-propeller repeat protein [Teredinibacter sp. KSP-S5-2]|uniref:PQQ-binding-like beta-propeller repeat protein n=1 Tax=Teredinibacter sp. KSP-S5-2 TaxID=3034506 RepID=UPI00293501D2|nr:PQQ-binding-like beta-propeller repeat protein [Teredinibacter sp. KSP-S5-2]WNO08263.1 PQQ-binding-like beta-propeller repeat protein [Teredinibacter sp. KSP-S5-2]
MEKITRLALTALGVIALLLTVSTPSLAGSGELLWKYKADGAIWGDVVVRGKTAYFGSDDNHMYAVDIGRQSLKWKAKTRGIVRSTPAFKRGHIYFTSDDGFLYALDKRTGALSWRLDLGDGDFVRNGPSNEPPWDYDWSKSSPVVAGQTLYVGSATGTFYAVNPYSGEVKWTYKVSTPIRATPSVFGKYVYFTNLGGEVTALNRKNGSVYWVFATGGRVVSQPSVIDGKVIVGGRDAHLYGINALTGELDWKYFYTDGSWVESSAIPGDEENTFFIASSDAKKVSKFDSTTGVEIWNTPMPGWSWGTPRLADDVLYIGSTATDDYWQPISRGFKAIDAETGDVLWQYQPAHVEQGFVNGGVHARPAVKFGKVFVGDVDGHLYVFEE